MLDSNVGRRMLNSDIGGRMTYSYISRRIKDSASVEGMIVSDIGRIMTNSEVEE